MMNALRRKYVHLLAFVLFLVSFNHSLQAQNYSEYNWLFGNSTTTITFNKSDGRAQLDTIQFVPFGTGGGAVISDPVTGNLLFYTDGENVYDANHDLVPNGGGLAGDASINRAASVMPMPYNDGEYYIFTNPGGSGAEILYTVVDRNATGNAVGGEPPLGDVDAARKNLSTGLTNPAEGMIVIQQDIDNYWVITNDRTTYDYQVLSIVNGTIGAVQVFDLNDVSAPDFEAASFAYNADSSLLAVAPRDASRNITLYNFDITTGALSLNSAILNTGNTDFATEAVYDVEWSSNGANLYISRHGGTGTVANLYQYNLDDPLNTVNSILFQPVFRSYGIQRGPDQNLYHLYQQNSTDAIEIGVILEADSLYNADSLFFNVNYDSLAFSPSAINATQFPHFPAPHFEAFDTVGFSYLDTCALRTTKFFSNVEPPPSSYFWELGDGFTTNAVNPVHIYQSAGTYNVSLTVELNGIMETYTTGVTVVDNDLMIDLGMDTVRCVGEIFTYDAGAGGASYFWNTGEFTQSINVDTTGLYSVAVVSAATGCVNYDYVQVTTYEDTNIFRNQWYFGENAGIDFNPPATSAITDANLMSSAQGASSVSDLNGDVLFYTNGETIWNKNHRVMDNGDNIGGDPNSSQGVMIVPLPNDSSIYYVFTSDPVYGDFSYDMKYAVVDMRKDTAQGEVIVKDVSLFTNSTERITAFGLGQGITWLVTHEYGNNQFRSYPLTPFGIGQPVTSAAGSVMRFDEEKTGKAQMKYAADGGVLALAFQDTDENYIEIFQVADSTGQITGLAKVDIQESAPTVIYGVEFSSSLQRLYVSTNGPSGSNLLQYDLDSLYTPTAVDDIEATKFVLGNDATLQYGALQTGSDGIIYMAVDGQTTMGTINSPNSDDAAASFNDGGFDLSGRTSRLGLPNFVQELPLSSQSPGIAFSNPCLGLPTAFDGTGTSVIDEFFWSFDDGTSANVEDTTHIYNLSGIYNVSLNVTNRCGLDTLFVEPVEIFPIPANPTVLDAVALCNGPITLEAWPVDTAAFSYTWSTGETTRSITVNSPSLITVFITNTEGCRSDPRETFVDDTRPVVDLGTDQIICQDTAFPDLDAANPGSTYTWLLNGSANGNVLRTQTVDTSVPGIFVYEVTVEDILNCVTTDQVAFNIENLPTFTTVGGTTTGCGNDDGTIDIDVTDTGSFTYSVTGPSTIGLTALVGPSTVTTPNVLQPGGYSIAVSNTLTGCTLSQVASVDDAGAGFTIDNYVPTPDCPGDGLLTFELAGPAPANVTYELYDEFGILVVGAGASPSPTFPVNNLDSGTYSIVVEELVSGNNCIQTLDNIILDGSPLAEYTTTPQNICGDEGEISIFPITVDPGISYTWSGTGIVGSSLGETITVSAGGNYNVTSSGAGFCEVTTTVNVVQSPAPEVEILTEGAECEGSLILFANVTNGLVGNGGYQWDNGANGSRRGIVSSGTYDVLVLDQGTGCTGTASRQVDVFSELTVFAAATPNCDENEEVFLTAYSNITEDVIFQWTAPSGAVLDDQSAEISIGESGLYNINVASTVSTCTANADLNVLVLPITEDQLLLGERETFCSEDPDPANNAVSLDPGQFSTYEWTIINDDNILSTDPVYVTSDAGIYEVTLSNGFTCIRDAIEVIDDCLPRVYAPNAFTPETTPGINDEFFVYPNPYVNDFEIKIFARWGELVYQSNSIDFRWDGVYRGKLLKIDTYIYVMRFTSTLMPELGQIEQRGGVALIR
ncbi:MAG: PKD domain-containing protein [Reichenbachiella sp.]|uniref:PKD domain-containing protein n=1 Tax=Reichenbachiella sp. TaxID=2184521 RepID=UPI003265155F